MLCITETFCRGCQHADSIIKKDSRPLIGYQEALAILRLNWNSSGGCLSHLPFPNRQTTGKVKRMWELFLLDDLAIECRIIVHRANCRRSPFALPVSEGSSAKLLVPVLDQNVKAIMTKSHTAIQLPHGGCTSDQFWSSWKSRGANFQISQGLVLHQRVLFGGQTVLHEGEGGITVVLWRGSLIAWMNPRGVKVYNVKSGQKARRFSERAGPWLVRIWYEYIVCTVIQTWNIEIYVYFIWYSIDTQWYTH